jgi:hypothetical protein
MSREQPRGPYRQRSLWRLHRVESSSADVLDHAAQGFPVFVDAGVWFGARLVLRICAERFGAAPVAATFCGSAIASTVRWRVLGLATSWVVDA